jgi:hypothetical protein
MNNPSTQRLPKQPVSIEPRTISEQLALNRRAVAIADEESRLVSHPDGWERRGLLQTLWRRPRPQAVS